MRLTGLSRFVKKKKKEKKTTEDREHDEEFGMPKAFASQLIQLKSLGWPNGFSMLQRNMFLRLRANLQRLCETWELGQLICPPFLILRILICIKNSRSNGTLVYHRDYLLFVYLPTSWIILVPCVFSRLPWIPMGLLMSMPGLVRLRFDLSNLVDGWRLQVERAGLVVVSAFGHIFSSTTTSQEAHGLHKTWNATQLLNIIIAVITAVISGESWQSACMAMDGHAYLPKYTPLLGQTSFFIPSRLLHWDGRLRISIENDDPFPVRLEFILFSCTEPWSQRRSSVKHFQMLPGTIFQAFHRFLCHIQHLFCHVTSWDDSIFELFPPFGRTIGIHYLPSPFNTPNWRSHRVTHFEIHFHLKKGLSFGQDSMISPHFNQTFYHAALCFTPFFHIDFSGQKSHCFMKVLSSEHARSGAKGWYTPAGDAVIPKRVDGFDPRLLFSFLIGLPMLVLNIVVVKPPYTVVISCMSVTCLALWNHGIFSASCHEHSRCW